jgi:hypothetical protein
VNYWFHSHDGWCWRRAEDGGVEIAPDMDDPSLIEESPPAFVFKLSGSEWASVVAHVSEGGETGESYRRVLEFHDGEDEV